MCPACSGQPTSPCERHPCDVFISFPHCSITSAPSLPTLGPSALPCRCASPSVSSHAQAVEPGTSVCCPVRPLMTHLHVGHLHGSSRSSDPGPVDQDPPVDRVGASLPHPRSAKTPRRPSRSLPSPRCFTHHISGSTSSHLPSPRVLHHGHCPHPVPSPGRHPPQPWV